MSGDVQPRKRKDKRRKKEGGSLGSIHEPIASHKFKRSESDDKKVFDLPEQGEKIHVQNEHGVGGNICVKIVFFCLFGLLIGAVGLIYMKSLGSTDVDLPTIEESRFAEYFTGWLDESSDDHEHETQENNLDLDHDEHEDEHDEHDDDEHDGLADHDKEDEHENEEEQEDMIYKLFGLGRNEADEAEEAEDERKEDIDTENEESEMRPDVDEDEEDDNDEEEEEEEEEEEKEADEEEEDEEESKNDSEDEEDINEEEKEDSGVALDEDDDDLSQMDEDEEEEDKFGASQENEDEESENKKNVFEEDEDKDEEKEEEDDKLEVQNDNKDDEDEDKDIKEEELKTEEEVDVSKEQDDYKTDNDDLGFEEINISEEDLEEEKENVEEPDSKKKLVSDNENELKMTDESENEEEETDSGGVAVKLGVGIALIIVAHLVLVKKWKSMNNVSTDETLSSEIKESKGIENLHSSVEPVISRRQTLVPENVYLNDDFEDEGLEDDQDDEEEEEEEYSEDECAEEEFKKSKSDNLETFEKLTLNIKKEQPKVVEDSENIFEEEEEEEEEEGDDEEEEVEEVEEKEEEYEGEEEEEEYIEDEELEEEEEEEEEVEDEEEDEEDQDENDYVQQKVETTEVREEQIDNATPIRPPRSKTGRGAQDIDEDSIDQYEDFSKFEETNQDGSKAGDETNNSGPEEQKAPENKVGNEDDWVFRQELDFADEQIENNPKVAVEAYDKVISKKPTTIRALIGRAKALDHWAEKEKSNAYLKQAMNAYKALLLDHGHLLDNETYVKLAERCIERMRFGGAFISAIDIHKALISKYPNTPKYRNTLAVTYLMLNKIPQARVLLKETLSLWPDDGFALVHYGFILKTSDNNMEEGAKKLMAGIQTRQEGVIDGMFFFHLGDALNRLGRGKEAMEWYELGVKEGLFLNKYQRSLYNVNRLKSQPWWTKEETTYQDFFKKLEENWREIRKEGLELLNSKGVDLFKEEAENLKDTGDWKQLDLYFRGRKQPNCYKAPLTCSLVSSFKPASTCTRGQIKFSVMLPNTHVWPHCGPTNCRLRSHLGLVVPKKTFIRVAEETRSWEEGKFIIFDDSFEHEVWHNGTSLRLVLIVDVWHPELTNHERRSLSPI